jgi:hypothetical protein
VSKEILCLLLDPDFKFAAGMEISIRKCVTTFAIFASGI